MASYGMNASMNTGFIPLSTPERYSGNGGRTTMSIGHTRCWAIKLRLKRPNNYATNDGSTKKNVVLIQGAGHHHEQVFEFVIKLLVSGD